jgi:hypothetical protein
VNPFPNTSAAAEPADASGPSEPPAAAPAELAGPAITPALPVGELSTAEWTNFVRVIERKRHLLSRAVAFGGDRPAEPDQLIAATVGSFQLEGLDVSEQMVDISMARHSRRRDMRSGQVQRVRNHVGILYRIDRSLAMREPMKVPTLIRWYASVGCGLCTTAPDESAVGRLELIVRRINSPRLRLQSALGEIARLHCELLSDKLFPAFNGILARLMLRYHLGRCRLPAVILAPTDASAIHDPAKFLRRLLERLDESFQRALRQYR